MKHTNADGDQPGSEEGPDGLQWTLRSVVHMIGAVGDFWSSELNRAAVDMADPQPGQVVLDLGAGLGPATVVAAKRVVPDGRVIAVEPSPILRRVLNLRRLWQSARPAIDIRNGTAEVIPVLASSVDMCWAVNAAHHFDDLALAASELARVLKPGGTLLLIEEDLSNHHMGRSGEGADRHGPVPVDPDHLNELLTAAGLTVTGSEDRTIGGVEATVTTSAKPSTTTS
jgi:SAM-dependent methyltransferase